MTLNGSSNSPVEFSCEDRGSGEFRCEVEDNNLRDAGYDDWIVVWTGNNPGDGSVINYQLNDWDTTEDPLDPTNVTGGGTGGTGTPTSVNYYVDTGDGTYGGMEVTHTSCGDPADGDVGILVETGSFPGSWDCDDYRLEYNGGNDMIWVFTTPYAQATPVDGDTLWAYLRDDDVEFELGYVQNDSFTSFGSVTEEVANGDDETFTIDISGISGTAPTGSVLA